MIHPSYVDLMQVVNQGVEEGEEPIISSRYSIVMATARRARQLVAGDDPLVENAAGRKALSVAVEELNRDRIKILTDEEKAEMEARREEEARAARSHAEDEEASADPAAELPEGDAEEARESDAEDAPESGAQDGGETAIHEGGEA